jgi:hypothetical protein
MTKKLAVKEMETIRGVLMSNAIQIDALAQLLIDKGLITEQEFFAELKMVHADFQRQGRSKKK